MYDRKNAGTSPSFLLHEEPFSQVKCALLFLSCMPDIVWAELETYTE